MCVFVRMLTENHKEQRSTEVNLVWFRQYILKCDIFKRKPLYQRYNNNTNIVEHTKYLLHCVETYATIDICDISRQILSLVQVWFVFYILVFAYHQRIYMNITIIQTIVRNMLITAELIRTIYI